MKKFSLFFCFISVIALQARAQSPIPPELIRYPDTILTNGKFLTVDENFSTAEAVAIRDGLILAVGTEARMSTLKGPETKMVDMKGRTVVPGLVQTDADNDLIAGNLYKDTLINRKLGKSIQALDKASILKEIGEVVATRPAGELIFFRGQEESMDALMMHAEDLDTVSPANPIAINITSSDMVVNTLMLEQVAERMPRRMAHPGIIKDEQGRPTGQLYGQATGMVGWDMRPWPTIDEAALNEQKEMFQGLHARGITSMVAHTQGFALSVISTLWHNDELTMRLFASHDFLRQNAYAEPFLRRLGNVIDFGLGDMVKIVGVGLASADGNADIGSALTIEPKLRSGGYAFAPRGENKWIGYGPHPEEWETTTTPRELTEWNNVQVAIKYGYNTTGIHNVGDQATKIWLDSIEEGLNQPNLVLRPQWRPFGLDHNMFWNKQNYEKVKQLDVRRGLGKMWQYPDMAVELYGDRIHDVQPVPELIATGFKVHIEGAEFEKVERYVTRQDQKGRTWGPDHSIDRETGLRMVTLWAARFIAEDHNIGSLEKGKKADMAVLGADYMTVPENEIGDIPVVTVMVDGKFVYGTP